MSVCACLCRVFVVAFCCSAFSRSRFIVLNRVNQTLFFDSCVHAPEVFPFRSVTLILPHRSVAERCSTVFPSVFPSPSPNDVFSAVCVQSLSSWHSPTLKNQSKSRGRKCAKCGRPAAKICIPSLLALLGKIVKPRRLRFDLTYCFEISKYCEERGS